MCIVLHRYSNPVHLVPRTEQIIKHVSELYYSRLELDSLVSNDSEIWLMIYPVHWPGKLPFFTTGMSQNGPASCSYGMLLVYICRLLRALKRDIGILEPGKADLNAAREQAKSFFNASPKAYSWGT